MWPSEVYKTQYSYLIQYHESQNKALFSYT